MYEESTSHRSEGHEDTTTRTTELFKMSLRPDGIYIPEKAGGEEIQLAQIEGLNSTKLKERVDNLLAKRFG